MTQPAPIENPAAARSASESPTNGKSTAPLPGERAGAPAAGAASASEPRRKDEPAPASEPRLATGSPAKALAPLPAARQKAIEQVIVGVRKTYGKTSITSMAEDSFEPVRTIPTGSLALDEAIGTGGYPRGRITEIFGPESSGKTTLTLHAIAEVQAMGGVAAFVDAEHAFDLDYARAIGVQPDRLLVSQPDFGEQALGIVEELVKSNVVDLVVVDSVAALVPKAEIEGDMGDLQPGSQARLMAKAMRKLTPVVHRSESAVLFINQLRQKIGVIFGSPETTPGGNALKYFASLRLDVRRTGKVQVGNEAVGNRTRARAVKNKCARPFGEAEFDIRWGIGIDRTVDLLEVALKKNVITKSGSHLQLAGKSFAQGMEKARDALLTNPELRGAIELLTFDALPGYAQRVRRVA